MATQLKLVLRSDESASDIDSLDLLSGGFHLAYQGWTQAVAGDDDASVQEAITLHIDGTSPNDLASLVQSLDEKVRQVALYRQSVERYSVWLRAQLGSEGGARQAFIRNARRGQAQVSSPFALNLSMLVDYVLGIERMPWWESAAQSVHTMTAIDCVGGIYDYGADPVVGDMPARMAQTRFVGVNGVGAALAKFWVGFRTDRFGDRTVFQPLWHTKDGALANSTSTTSDATAQSGTRTTCTFGSGAMLPRVTVTTSQATSDPSDQRGEYLVLLRAKLSAGSTTCRVRLLDGYYNESGDSNFTTRDRVAITSTSWNLYEMGVVKLPPLVQGEYASVFNLTNYALRLEAERTAGTANLHMDCFILIPRAEGFFYCSDAAVEYFSGANRSPAILYQAPDGKQSAVWTAASIIYRAIPGRVEGGMPVGEGIVVVAGQQASQSALTDVVDIQIRSYPRWATLRGAE